MRIPIALVSFPALLASCTTAGGAAPDAGVPESATDDGGSADAGAVTCPTTALAPGDTTAMLVSGGMTRSYVVHLPTGYTGQTPVPLVFDFHPLTITAAEWKAFTPWSAASDKEGFIIVWPQGYMNSWNVGRCCNPAWSANVDDVAFVRAIIAQVSTEACVDPKRIYASGCSNGGGMSYKLACDAADVFAAVAPVDFDCLTGPTNTPSCGDCSPSRPISEWQFRGTADMFVPYDGGPTSVVAGLIFPGAQANFADWGARNGCTGSPQADSQHPACQTYPSCPAGTETALCTVPQGTHCGNYKNFDVVDIAWEMFQRQKLP